MAKTHLRSFEAEGYTLCDRPIESAAWKDDRLPTADTLVDVHGACALCARRESQRVPPFVRTPAVKAQFGAREITTRLPERIDVDEAPRPRWPSPEAAVRSYVRWRTEGEAFGWLRSSSGASPDRVQAARDPSEGGREHAGARRYRNVSLALVRTERDPESRAYFTEIAYGARPVTFTPIPANDNGGPIAANDNAIPIGRPDVQRATVIARAAYELAVGGLPLYKRTRRGGREAKGWFIEWLAYPHEEVARKISETHGCALSEYQVTLLCRTWSWSVREFLFGAGELGAREEREERSSRAFDPVSRMREAVG